MSRHSKKRKKIYANQKRSVARLRKDRPHRRPQSQSPLAQMDVPGRRTGRARLVSCPGDSKLSHAAYPCQRAAAPLGIGFLTYCVALAGYAFSFTKVRSLLRNKKRVLAGSVLRLRSYRCLFLLRMTPVLLLRRILSARQKESFPDGLRGSMTPMRQNGLALETIGTQPSTLRRNITSPLPQASHRFPAGRTMPIHGTKYFTGSTMFTVAQARVIRPVT